MKEGDKKDVKIYTETPATGISNGIEIVITAEQDQKTTTEASGNLKEEKEEAKKDEKEKTDSSGEDG